MLHTFPLAGTRPRGKTLEEDQVLETELLLSLIHIFVVCIHDGHKAGVFPDGFSHLLRPHKSCIVYIQKGDLKALLFQFFQGMQNGMVFKRRGNNMLFASAHPQRSGGHNGLVIRLAASGGKRDLPRIGMEDVYKRQE